MKHSIKDSRGCIVDDLKLNTIQVECPTKCSLALPAVYGQGLVILVMYLQLVTLHALKSRGTGAISTHLKMMKLMQGPFMDESSICKAASASPSFPPASVHLLIESLGR